MCSKACLAISYTACRFKTQTEATHSQNKVGKWWVHGAATLSSLQGKWRHATARMCSSRSSYTGLHCQAHLIDSLPCFCAGLKVWDPVGKCRRLRLLLRDHLLPESKGRGWGQRIESAALCAVQALHSPVLQHNQRQHGTGFFIKGQPARAPAAWPAHTLAPARSHLLPTRTIAVLLVSSFCKRVIGRWAQLECSPEQRRGMASLLACHEEDAHDEGDGGRAHKNSSRCVHVGYTLRRGAR